MLNVLLESKAQHTRRFGGTLASALIHGAIITAAVLLTVQPPRVLTKDEPPHGDLIFRTPVTHAPTEQRPATPRQPTQQPATPTIKIPPMDAISTTTQSVETQVAPIGQGDLAVGPVTQIVTEGPPGTGAPAGNNEAIDVRLVEKPPRVLHSENPHFPEALRARGQGGRIVVQFVVDTLGRAEMSEFKVVDATDAQLADPVRAVLPRFRFTPGEAGGRKVRTMVALPFDFTLVR
ncbi:MAG: energy transducer TonB [Gemmatimonadetes bacterium]|nr:energy transducer TonB [Gemmatimonadota bacterium]